MESTRQIALAYQQSGDLPQAQAQLDELDVANAGQWLIFVTEQSISQGSPANVLEALVRLVYDLNLYSAQISRYAEDQGLPHRGVSLVNQVADAVNPPAQPGEQGSSPAEPPTQSPPEPSPTPAMAQETPTETPEPTPEPPTPTPEPVVEEPALHATDPMNVRAGPGTEYPVVNTMSAGESAAILGRNPAGDWWQVELDDASIGWVYGPLVETSGPVDQVAVAASIPTPPPATPTPPPQPTATPVPAGPDFRLVEQRLWSVEENGGFLAGESVNCGGGQVLRVIVKDAAGNPLNGVTVQGVYRNELHTTGEKGPGIAEFDVNVDGDDIVVLRDVDGREVTSDRAKGNTAKTYNIPFSQLIQGRYCKDDASCQAFVDTNGCFGHFSWTVVFQRSY